MPWYAIGSIIVFPTFAGIFVPPSFINSKDGNDDIINPELRLYWYIILPSLFNIGWSFVQISHMSIVNSLSNSTKVRDTMVNNRNGFSYFSKITVLLSALAAFAYIKDRYQQFRFICYVCLSIGSFTSLFFIYIIDEVRLT